MTDTWTRHIVTELCVCCTSAYMLDSLTMDESDNTGKDMVGGDTGLRDHRHP